MIRTGPWLPRCRRDPLRVFQIAYGDSGIDAEPFYGCLGVIVPPVR